MGVKVVQSTAEFKVGDVLECPHGVLFLVTHIFDNERYETTVMYSHGDDPANHHKCAKRVIDIRTLAEDENGKPE